MAIKAVCDNWLRCGNEQLTSCSVRRQMPRSLNPPNGACIVNLYYKGYYKKKYSIRKDRIKEQYGIITKVGQEQMLVLKWLGTEEV